MQEIQQCLSVSSSEALSVRQRTLADPLELITLGCITTSQRASHSLRAAGSTRAARSLDRRRAEVRWDPRSAAAPDQPSVSETLQVCRTLMIEAAGELKGIDSPLAAACTIRAQSARAGALPPPSGFRATPRPSTSGAGSYLAEEARFTFEAFVAAVALRRYAAVNKLVTSKPYVSELVGSSVWSEPSSSELAAAADRRGVTETNGGPRPQSWSLEQLMGELPHRRCDRRSAVQAFVDRGLPVTLGECEVTAVCVSPRGDKAVARTGVGDYPVRRVRDRWRIDRL